MIRRFRVVVMVALAAHLACSNAAVDKAVGTATDSPAVVVTRTETGMSVRNQVGRPLLNIRIAIDAGASGAFVYTLPTLDTGAARDVRFADFRTEEGTLFEPASATPTQVKTTARDTLGNNYDTTTPWNP